MTCGIRATEIDYFFIGKTFSIDGFEMANVDLCGYANIDT